MADSRMRAATAALVAPAAFAAAHPERPLEEQVGWGRDAGLAHTLLCEQGVRTLEGLCKGGDEPDNS